MDLIQTAPTCLVSPVNLAPLGAVSGGNWSVPASNLEDGPWITRGARCAQVGDLADSQFDVTFPSVQLVCVIGLLWHTLSIRARWRVRLAVPGGTLEEPELDSGWMPVFPRQAASLVIPWEAPDWWTGQPGSRDLDLYPRHAWWTAPWKAGVRGAAAAQRTGAIRVEIDDRERLAAGEASNAFDIGGLWIGGQLAPAPVANFERGRTVAQHDRSQVDETPGGRLVGLAKPARRTVSLGWTGLAASEVDGLLDAGARTLAGAPVVFMADPASPARVWREAFPASWRERPAAGFGFDGAHGVRAVLQEVIG
jgi:hypothetical protein